MPVVLDYNISPDISRGSSGKSVSKSGQSKCSIWCCLAGPVLSGEVYAAPALSPAAAARLRAAHGAEVLDRKLRSQTWCLSRKSIDIDTANIEQSNYPEK